MIGYRVTKYDPRNRNEKGWYMKDEWTDYSDIGSSFDDKVFTVEDYINIENKYINVLTNLMKKIGVEYLNFNQGKLELVDEDDNSTEDMKRIYKKINITKKVIMKEVPDMVRLILRNCIWGTLKSDKMEVHFGWDYYMYIGLEKYDDTLMNQITPKGMYWERYVLPTYTDESL